MPARITIEFYYPTIAEYWTNRYFTSDAWTAAGTTMDALVAAHRPVLFDTAFITKIRVDDGVEDTDNFDTVSVNLAGTYAIAGLNPLPFWNVARVDFDVAGGGRPSRKYLRGILTEQNCNFTALESGLTTLLNTYADAVVATGAIIDPQGNDFVDGVVWPMPAMRQLRRGSKKKVIP
jgi:hypothetical protein